MRPRIAVIGDFNPDYIYHQATNRALEDSARRLGVELMYAWVSTASIAEKGPAILQRFDGLWASPGSPYQSMEGALDGIRFARESGCPFVAT